ncbi:Fe-S cluster assembly protein SufD [Gulosibacter macacae]|uniref:Fe-S cluster assembly protein SufD n=1 Tax=Gulosibacter macacae TaxID=2488791 RepID=A0A3P3W311_9MICO|nr:Fe-S cluster assembly protein SufD [Gulosibacter macacae]RRJ87223.1 Fe-S cluster assembly protein SufD [Gulosibacter macacae]
MTTTTPTIVPNNATKFVPVQTRSERLASFEPTDFEVPTAATPGWRYSPIAKLKELFRNEPGDGSVSYDVDAPEGILVSTLGAGVAPRGTGFVPEDLPAAIASKHVTEALYVKVPREVERDEPVRVKIQGSSADQRDLGHLVLHAESHSRATIILEYSGSATYAENVEIIVDDEADLKVIAFHEWEDDTIHAGNHQAIVGRDGKLDHSLITFGGEVVRVNPTLHLNGNGADGEARGLYYADAGQFFEHQVFVDHAGERTHTDVNYKGALQGAGARTVWIGDVLIRQGAVGTDSYEQNRNLVLSDGARADSVPNLEIECGDIEGAGHASATGRFDEEQLFYLMARGIDELAARRLVVHGFLNEIVQRLGDAELIERVEATLERELAIADEAIAAIAAREAEEAQEERA